MKRPRIVFFGNSDFSVTILDALTRAPFDIVAVITSPDEPKGRGGRLAPPPAALYAQEQSLPLIQQKRIIKDVVPSCDLGVIASYGHIIPNEILMIPTHGTLNVHPSLLPHLRGPSPIQTALADGLTKTGMTIMLTDGEMDHGPIIAQESLAIVDTDDAESLEKKLALLGAKLLVETIPSWLAGTLKAREQDHTQATYTKLLTKETGHIDWSKNANEIINGIRAHKVWPTSWSILDESRVKIVHAKTTPHTRPHGVVPGTLYAAQNKILVATQDFFIELLFIQQANRSIITGSAWLAGSHNALSGKVLR